MSLYYDPESPLLSAEAQALEANSPDTAEAQAMVAERLLGLVGTALQDEDAAEAASAVSIQINWQLANGDSIGIASETRGSRSVTYTAGGASTVSPVALEIVSGLLPTTSRWSGFGPRR